MGQRMSSDNHKAGSAAARHTAPKAVVVLPEEERYLGRCWLLAASPDSFSPSRWFALTDANADGARGQERRAFALSPDVLKPSARLRQPTLRDLGINVHKGLSVCGYANVTVAAVSAHVARQHRSLRVGGVSVALPQATPSLSQPQREVEDGERRGGVCLLVVVRRASVEMEPRDYAAAPYTRFPIRAPPTTPEDRTAYGEGCITGLLYGATAVLHVTGATESIAQSLLQCCEAAARERRVPPSAIQLQTERVSAGQQAAPEAPSGADVSVSVIDVRASQEAGVALREAVVRAVADAPSLSLALEAVARWAVEVHQQPAAWTVLNLFMQRYEAIAESLLVK